MQLINFKLFFFLFISFYSFAQKSSQYQINAKFKGNILILEIKNLSNDYLTFFDKKIVTRKGILNSKQIINSASILHYKDVETINLSSKLYIEEYFVKSIDLFLKKNRFVNRYIEPFETISYKLKINKIDKKKRIKIILTIDNNNIDFFID